MSYEPTIWQTGDVITAEKLNKIEQALYELSGGGGDEPPAGYVTVAPKQSVTITNGNRTLNTVEGYNLPADTPEDWIAIFDGNVGEYDSGEGCIAFFNDTTYYNVYIQDDALDFVVYNSVTGEAIAGTYEVGVYAPENSDSGNTENEGV